MSHLKRFVKAILLLFKNWGAHENSVQSAAIAFYTIFSLAPTLVIGVFVLGLWLGEDQARDMVIKETQELMGDKGAQVATVAIDSFTSQGRGLAASVVSIGFLLFGASRAFAEIRRALNRIFEFKSEHPSTIYQVLEVVKGRLTGFTLVIMLAFFMMLSLVLSTLISAFSVWLNQYLPIGYYLIRIFDLLFPIVTIGVIFALMLRFLPSGRIPWRYTWVGAFMSALVFSVTKKLIGIYLGKFMTTSAYGAAGSLIIVIMWVYLNLHILLLGAEICQVHRNYKDIEA